MSMQQELSSDATSALEQVLPPILEQLDEARQDYGELLRLLKA